MYKAIKNVAAIHDMSGFGRCSLTAAIPILSVLGVQPSPFPTALLSCQTEYPEFSFLDLTDEMKEYKNSWKNLSFKFDGIYSGFLGSLSQIDIVKEFILEHSESLIIIDPVMGDNGEIYKTYTEEMCEKIKDLVKLADVVTPNITESCILTNRNFKDIEFNEENLLNIAKDISDLGPKRVVITGILNNGKVQNFAYNKENKKHFITSAKYNEKSYSGTGDIFASILCGMLIKDFDFEFTVRKASEFIYNSIKLTSGYNIDPRNGIVFEPLLKDLIL